jgi:hypothetical protein
MAKKETIISILIYNLRRVYCSNNMLYTGSMDETNFDRYTVEYDDPIPIYCDNTSAINISKNPVMHSKTKHIPIKYHFLREQVSEKNIRVEYVGTKEQVADIFTKLLPREAFEYFRQRLRVISTPK